MKKRFTSLLLVLAMLMSMVVVPAYAAETPSMTLDAVTFTEKQYPVEAAAVDTPINPGTVFMLKVAFNAKDAVTLGAFSAKVKYNASAFELYNYSYAGEWSTVQVGPVSPAAPNVGMAFQGTPWGLTVNTETPGVAAWNAASTNYVNVAENGMVVLGCLLLKVKADAENADYDFEFIVDGEGELNQNYVSHSNATRVENVDVSAKATVTVTGGAAPTLGSVGLSGADYDDENSYYTITVAGGENEAKIVTATATSTSKKDITTGVTWTVEPADQGVYITPDKVGEFYVTANAKAGDYTITATPIANSSQGEMKSVVLKVVREASVPANITISGGQAEVLIPATGTEPAKSTEFVATVTDQYGENYQGSAAVTWKIEEDEAAVDGITIEEGVVSVTADVKNRIDRGAEKTMTITATCGDKSATAEIVVKREQPAGTTVKLFDAGSSEVSEVNITIPVSGSAEEKTYTAKLYDQYGEEMVGDFEWTTEGDVPYGTTMSGGTITVAVNAEGDGTFTLKATDRTSRKSATMNVTVSKLNADWSNTGLTVEGSPVYGMANSAIVTAAAGTLKYNTDGTETYSKTLTGTYTLVDPDTVQDAGDRTIAVKFVADNNEANGEYKGIELTGTIPVTIAKKEVTVSGIKAKEKPYDGTDAATLDYSAVVFKDSSANVVSDDNLTITATGTFADKNVGEDKNVTISELALSDSAAGNYELATEGNQTETTGTITAKEVTVSGITAKNKEYDGETDATLYYSNVAFDGIVSGDTLSVSTATGTFANKNVGEKKTVTISDITLGNNELGNYVLAESGNQTSTTANITAKKVTVSGITADDKTYDGNTTATVNTDDADIEGVVEGDTVTIDKTNASGTFADKNVGTGKTVTITGITLGGTDAGNYTFTANSATTTANITAKEVVVSGITAVDKDYDGKTVATLVTTGAVFDGIVSSDVLTVTAEGIFGSADAGEDKTVTISGLTLTGTDAGNYVLGAGCQQETDATIHKAKLTISGITAENKTYDGNSAAVLNSNSEWTIEGLAENECALEYHTDPSFDNKNAGTNKTVTINLTLGGDNAKNYELTEDSQKTTTANIDPRPVVITGTITAENKTYDGTTDAVINASGLTISNKVGEDNVAVSVKANVKGTFADKNVGNDKPVSLSGDSFELTGADKANYVLNANVSVEGLKANITAKEVTVSGITAANMVYNGKTDATLDYSNAKFEGIVSGDTLTVTAVGAFENATAGEGKTVAISNLVLGGTDAGNYELKDSGQQETATANITKAALTVTAKPKTIIYGAAPANDGVEYSGFVNGEDAEVLTGTLGYDYNYAQYGDVGAYTITPSGLDATNYTITFKTGVLTVEQKTIESLTWSNYSGLYYNGEAKNVTATADGLCTVGEVLDEVIVTVSGGNRTAIGVYTAKATGLTGAKAGNYKLAENLTQAYSIVAAVSSVAVTPETVTAVVDNDKLTIKLVGYVSGNESITVNGNTVTEENKTLVVGAGDDAVTYTIDDSGVTVMSVAVTATSGAADVSGLDNIDEEKQSAVNTALTNAATTVTGMDKAAASQMQKEAEAAPAGATKMTVEFSLSIEPKAYDGSASLKLEIKPQITVTYKAEDNTQVGETTTKNIPNSEIKAPVTVSVKLPSGMATANLFAKHALGGGKFEYLPVTVVGGVASWQQSSFSEVELISNDDTATVTFNFENGSSQTVTYTAANIGDALPTDSKSGQVFSGWKFTGVAGATDTYTTLTEELLAALDADSAEGTQSQFTAASSGSSTPGGIAPSLTLPYKTASASASKGGSISPSGVVKLEKGESVTFTFTPDVGYHVKDVLVNGKSVGARSSYTIEGADENYTIKVIFEKDVASAMPFVDVAPGAYYYDAVLWALEEGITGGKTATTFAPKEACTRGQMVTFLWRAAGMPEPTTTVNPFVDVNASKYYYKAVLWALEEGITGGKTATTFDPNAACTRGQMATFLWRAAGEPAVSGMNVFNDVKAGKYYYEAVLWAAESGITNGKTAATFVPNEACNRGQMVTFLYRNEMAD